MDGVAIPKPKRPSPIACAAATRPEPRAINNLEPMLLARVAFGSSGACQAVTCRLADTPAATATPGVDRPS